MSVPKLVRDFYEQIWNAGDLEAVGRLVSEDFVFRGSLGSECHGRESFTGYVQSVRNALSVYRCEILECVTEGDQAFARMCFSGIHVADFRGFQPTGLPVRWSGAALFRLGQNAITEVWVLGDLVGLDCILKENQTRKENQTQTL